jgi:acyl-CoA synthetase (AMP-forming)/AMP-acid ligase II
MVLIGDESSLNPKPLKAVRFPWCSLVMNLLSLPFLQVMFRGNIVMKGYLKNKKATDKELKGGWFHSGDLGVMHSNGYIELKVTA